MKTLICISHVPDTTTKIQYTADGTDLDKTGVTFVINPFDEYGLVRAIEFTEAGLRRLYRIDSLSESMQNDSRRSF